MRRWSGELTPREAEVLRLAATGLSYQQIAAQLGIGERTISKHMGMVGCILGTKGRDAIIAEARSRGLVE